MNLYLISVTYESIEWDQYDSMVIRHNTAEEAILFSIEKFGGPGRTEWPSYPVELKCEQIGITNNRDPDEEPDIIITSFNAG